MDTFKMSFFVVSLLLTFLLPTGNCDHHHHHNDDVNWPTLVSQIEFLWKSTSAVPVDKEPTESHDKGHHWSSHKAEDFTTEASTTKLVIQNGTFVEGVKNTFRASLALLVGVPIFGVLFVCCFCYCCCKCCGLCCEDEEKGQVIVMQQNNAAAAPQPQRIIVQQPVYQTPPYVMQPPPQWSPHQQFPSANAAYDNPNYGAPSAPPQYAQKY